MAEIRWTPEAASDLEAIVEFVSSDSEAYAQMLAANILRTIERLADFPKLGRQVPEARRPDVREVFYRSYRIIYRLKLDAVEILTIYHGSRVLDPDILSR